MRRAIVTAGFVLGLGGCNSLLGLDEDSPPDQAPSSSSSSGTSASPPSGGDGTSSGATGSSSGAGSSSSGSSSSGSSSGGSSGGTSSSSGGSSSGGRPPEETRERIASGLPGGLRVAVSPTNVFWLAQGTLDGAEYRHVLSRRSLAASCALVTGCGVVVHDATDAPYFRGPTSSRLHWQGGRLCLSVGAFPYCVVGDGPIANTVGGPHSRATLARVLDGRAYLLDYAGTPLSAIVRERPLAQNAVFTTSLTRPALGFTDVEVDAAGMVWAETSANGTTHTVYQRNGDDSIHQLGLPHEGAATLTLDATYAYVAFADGHVVRSLRTAPFTEELLAMRSAPRTPTRRGALLFWLDAASSEVVSMRADGQGTVRVLDNAPFLQDFAVDDTHVYTVTFSNSAEEPNSGAVTRVRYVP